MSSAICFNLDQSKNLLPGYGITQEVVGQILWVSWRETPPHHARIQLNYCQLYAFLTIYFINTHFDASATDSFRKHFGKRRNCS